MIWLIGCSELASDYAKVLTHLKQEFQVIGRSEKSAQEFEARCGIKPITGGIEQFVNSTQSTPDSVIVCVDINNLTPVTKLLISKGIKKILVEKPAGLKINDIQELSSLSEETKTIVNVAYNRHYYNSVINLIHMAKQDGGITSIHFDFTEWSHLFDKNYKALGVMEKWLIANSSHIIDLAFYIAGKPEKYQFRTSNTYPISWHPSASVFVGSGITQAGIPFTYHSNWISPGRWGIEVNTIKHKYILRPIEKLFIQKIGELTTTEILANDNDDVEFKPGLKKQVKSFIENNFEYSCTIKDHLNNFKFYLDIGNYESSN